VRRWRLPPAAALVCLIAQTGAAIAADAPPGASSCTGCHAARPAGPPVPRLEGAKSAELAAALRDFKSGKRPATVMGRIAKGFSDPEIDALARWFETER
jgi:cytochrome subunit of sulfide dehydrogenase